MATTSKYDYKLYFYKPNEIIQFLQQPKMPVGFKCEMEEFMDDLGPCGHTAYPTYSSKPKTTTNSQGLTQWVGEYIY